MTRLFALIAPYASVQPYRMPGDPGGGVTRAATMFMVTSAVDCEVGQYRVGGNPGTCQACDFITCEITQERIGTCTGTTNDYSCRDMLPVDCTTNEYRASGTPGTCQACENVACGSGQVRTGSCTGVTNGFSCTATPQGELTVNQVTATFGVGFETEPTPQELADVSETFCEAFQGTLSGQIVLESSLQQNIPEPECSLVAARRHRRQAGVCPVPCVLGERKKDCIHNTKSVLSACLSCRGDRWCRWWSDKPFLQM